MLTQTLRLTPVLVGALMLTTTGAVQATDFETYASWPVETQDRFQGWLLNQMEDQAFRRSDTALVQCLCEKFRAGTPEKARSQGA